jgi:hypothetical protein
VCLGLIGNGRWWGSARAPTSLSHHIFVMFCWFEKQNTWQNIMPRNGCEIGRGHSVTSGLGRQWTLAAGDTQPMIGASASRKEIRWTFGTWDEKGDMGCGASTNSPHSPYLMEEAEQQVCSFACPLDAAGVLCSDGCCATHSPEFGRGSLCVLRAAHQLHDKSIPTKLAVSSLPQHVDASDAPSLQVSISTGGRGNS